MDVKYDQLPTLSPQQSPVTPQVSPPVTSSQPQQTPPPQPPQTPPTVLSTPPPIPPTDTPPKGPAIRISKKLLLIVGVILVCVIILVVVVLMRRQPQNKAQVTVAEQKQIEAKYKGKDKSADNNYMAQTLLTWLNKTRLADGRYAFSQTCTSAKQCQVQAADNRLGPQVVWGEFEYYKKHPTPALLAQINNDISTYTNEAVVPVVQNNFWNCKYMYELWQSKIFTPSQKDKIKLLCTRSQQPPLINTDQSATISDADVAPLMQAALDGQSTATSSGAVQTVAAFASNTTAVSDLVTESIWLKDDSLYSLALGYFRQSLADYSQSQESLKEAAPLLGIAALDLYKKSGKGLYLTFAESMFLKNNNELCGSLDHCINSVFLAKDLNMTTGNNDYQYFVNNSLRHLGQTQFDGNGFGGFQFGTKAFYSPDTHAVYPVLENSLLLGIYSTQ